MDSNTNNQRSENPSQPPRSSMPPPTSTSTTAIETTTKFEFFLEKEDGTIQLLTGAATAEGGDDDDGSGDLLLDLGRIAALSSVGGGQGGSNKGAKLRVRRVTKLPVSTWSANTTIQEDGTNGQLTSSSGADPGNSTTTEPSTPSFPLPLLVKRRSQSETASDSIRSTESGGKSSGRFPMPGRNSQGASSMISASAEFSTRSTASSSSSIVPAAATSNYNLLESAPSPAAQPPQPPPPIPRRSGPMQMSTLSEDLSGSMRVAAQDLSDHQSNMNGVAFVDGRGGGDNDDAGPSALPPPPPPLPPPAPMSANTRANTTGEKMPNKRRMSHLLRPKLNGQRDKRMSMRVLAQLSSFSDTLGQNTLHKICGSTSGLNLLRVQDTMEKFPNMVRQKDEKGQLPLHILGNNSDIINHWDSQKIATKVAILLMDAYPQSIISPDNEGRMPFTFLILKWVEWTFDQEEINNNNKANNSDAGSVSSSSASHTGCSILKPKPGDDCCVSEIISKIKAKSKQSTKSINNNNKRSTFIAGSSRHSGSAPPSNGGGRGGRSSSDGNLADTLRDSISSKSSNRFPPVLIFDEVEWCFDMLSLGMDHLGGKPLDPAKKVRPKLAYSNQRKERKALAENIAEIPMLIKTILLLESQQTRTKIMECSAIRRTLLCNEVIGPWLTTMIRYKRGTSSEVAVDFLQIISKLGVADYVGEYRKPLPHDDEFFKESKLEVYKEAEKLGDMIPTILMCGEERTNRAVSTSLIWFVMNRRLATSFTIGVGFTDFKLHITALLAFRQLVINNLDSGEFWVLFPWMKLDMVIFWEAVHHLVRKLCEFAALGQISKRTTKRVVLDFWSVLDILAVVLAFWATVHIQETNDGDGLVPLYFLMSIILGMMWLRLVGFLRVVNEQLATFILALTRILFDIRFFSLVLFVFILMFGDMFQLSVRNNPDIDCSSEDLDPAIEEFCSQRSIESYLRTYAIVVGDFEFEQYNRLGAVTFFWFMVTFFGTVVMLNVMIAVVTMSYGEAQEDSVILFRRARAQFLATHETMEQFLRPSVSNFASRMPVLSFTYVGLISIRWLMLLTYLATTLFSTLYVIEITAYTARKGTYAMTAFFVFFVIVIIGSLWFVVSFVVQVLVEQFLPKEGQAREGILEHVERGNERTVKKLVHAFGIDRYDTEGGEVFKTKGNAEILARLDQLEGMLEHILAKNVREEEEELEANFEEDPLQSPIPEDEEYNLEY